jgi:hypothetical protein
MITRRMALGTGLALATGVSSGAYGAMATGRRDLPEIDAFLLDRTIQMPHQLAAFLAASEPTLTVVGIDLDAVAHPGLMRILADSSTVIGVSCGATLFCLERLAWDHGLRLKQRHSWPASETRWQDVACLLNGNAITSHPTSMSRTYAPSRTDGVLHSWMMEKPDGARSGRNFGVRS